MKYYILKGKKAVPTNDPEKWVEWFRKANRTLKQETLPNGKWISTVFLGLDYDFMGKGKPLLFETGVFTKKENWDDIEIVRYSTYNEAMEGHKKMVKKWKNFKKKY